MNTQNTELLINHTFEHFCLANNQLQTHRRDQWGIKGAKVLHWCLLPQASSKAKDGPNDYLYIQERREKS